MARKPIEKIRNTGIIAHIDAGKTTVTERFLYYSGKTHKLGEVHEGQAIMDFREDERERGITISSAATTFLWRDYQINLIDTPGHVDFTAEVERSLRVLDGAVVVFDAVEGVEPQSETVWHQADRYGVPRICFVNKMDRVGADFEQAVRDIREKLGGVPAVVQQPFGAGEEFSGIVDLIEQRLLAWEPKSLGERFDSLPIPQELAGPCGEARARLIECLADHVDSIAEKYLEGRSFAPEELREALRRATIAGAVVPVLCGAALRNTGIQLLLDAVCLYLPSPLDIPPAIGHEPRSGKPLTRRPDPKEPVSALIFKVTASPAADLYYLRVYSGRVESGGWGLNTRTGERERL
ncbi:MAG: elongation factor G, partial [Acidobacteria bacterium]